MRMEFSVTIPATSANLGPGFDCMGLAVNLFNQFRVTTESDFSISITGIAASDISTRQDNLFIQAANRFLTTVKSSVSSLSWKVDMMTGIPSSSGLGSSASAIAAGMLLANEIVGCYEPEKKLSRFEVVQEATRMEGHPDNVVPAMLGGAWLALYHEQRLQAFNLSLPPDLRFVVATPNLRISTDESRRSLTPTVCRSDAVYNVAQGARLVLALERHDLRLLEENFGDRLHEPQRLETIPYSQAVADACKACGATMMTLSGSGPSLLLWCDGDTTAAAVQTTLQDLWMDKGVQASVTIRRPWLERPVVSVSTAAVDIRNSARR